VKAISEFTNIKGNFRSDFHCAGPLNLNRKIKQAYTVTGHELTLTDKEFEALDLLVSLEGEYLSLDQLHRDIWGASANREETRRCLEAIVEQINSSGDGFMWINYLPAHGFAFQIHWGRFKNECKQEVTHEAFFKLNEKNIAGIHAINARFKIAAIFIIACILFASVVTTINIMREDNGEYFAELEDEFVPLSMPDYYWETDDPDDPDEINEE